MALANSTLITVSATYTRLDGRAASGQVFFSSNQVLVNSTSGEIVPPVDFVATLDANGAISIDLPATDDPDYEPQGWTYTVTEDTDGGDRPPFGLSVPADGGAIDLADVAPPGPTESLTADEYTLLSTFTSHRSAWGGDPPAGSADDLIGLDANNVPKAVPSGSYQLANALDIRHKGADDTGAASAVQATRDALAERDTVIITGGTYLFDGQVDVLGKHLHIAADATILVANGYTGTVFRMLGDDAQEAGSFQEGRPAITGRGLLVEDGTPANNWTGVEVFADGNAGSDFVSNGVIGTLLIDHVGTGIRLHADDASGGNGFISGMTIMAMVDHCVVGVEESETNGGRILHNTYLTTQVQTRSALTTDGFKVQGANESFIDCMAWDYTSTGATPMTIASNAVGTHVDGGNLTVEDVVDNGTRTFFTGRPRLSDDGLSLDAPIGDWPQGYSVMYATSSNPGGTPNGGDGVAIIWRAGDAGHQHFFPHGDATDFLYFRSWNNAGTAWLGWKENAAKGDPHASQHEPGGADFVSYQLANDENSLDAAPSSWPTGLSTMYANSTNPGGTPNGGDGVVVTRRAASATNQHFFPHADATDFLYVRSWNASTSAWLAWLKVGLGKSGQTTFSGDGTATTFAIPHGLYAAPSSRAIWAESADAAGDKYVSSVDATNINVTFVAAPPTGTDNVVLGFDARL